MIDGKLRPTEFVLVLREILFDGVNVEHGSSNNRSASPVTWEWFVLPAVIYRESYKTLFQIQTEISTPVFKCLM